MSTFWQEFWETGSFSKVKQITIRPSSNPTPRYLLKKNSNVYPDKTLPIAALFLRTSDWKQPKYPLVGKEADKMCHSHTMECYSAVKRNEAMAQTTTCVDLADMMLRERRQMQNARECMIPFM